MLVAVGCVALTILSYLITRSSGPVVEGAVNTLIGIGAIALITPLVLKEQASRQAHDRLQVEVEKNTQQALLLDQTHDSIFLRNMNGVITFWNRGAQELFGWSAEEVVDKVSEDLLKTVFPVPLKEIDAEVIRRGRWEGELVRTRKDGSQVVMASRWSLQRDHTGAAVALLETSNDITDRKRVEEAAQRSDEEVRDVLETMPAIFFAASPDGLATFQNRAWTEYSGLSAQASLGNGWTVAVHPDDVDRHVSKWRACLGGKPFEDEVRHRSVNGEYRWFLTRGVPLRDEHGKIVKWYGLLTDIEDRKRAECLLAGEKRILEMVAKGDSLPEILDALCRLVEEQASGTLASILLVEGDRLRRAEAPSLPRSFTDAIGETAIGPLACCGAAAYRGEQIIVEDVAVDPLWADYRDLALRHSLRACWSIPVFSSQRKVVATFAMYYREPRRPTSRDQELIEQITHLAGVAIERKQAEEERDRVSQLEADLAHMNRVSMMGDMTASIAHELNQPLAGVVSNGSACLRWLDRDSPNLEEACETARRIVRDGKRAGEIISRIRALASKTVTPKTKLDLNETIGEVLALVGDETKRRSIAIRTEFADALDPVLGDRVQLQQVVLNVIMNGLDAMNGVVSKRLFIATCNIDHGQVRVTVADTGSGIDPDKMEKVFDPFFSTKPHGMGMGLSISRSIIQSHGGRLWLTANDGPGVTTQFTIPQYQEGPVE
jgi:PAS domain S-box-containing protein